MLSFLKYLILVFTIFFHQYTFFILGIVLGISIAIYFYASREEKIEQAIKNNQKRFSTEKLDSAMERVVERIETRTKEAQRELTEDEKNDIIIQCCKKEFLL